MSLTGSEKWFYFDAKGRQVGPLTGMELLADAHHGRVVATTFVRREDWEKPAMAATVRGLREAVPHFDLHAVDIHDFEQEVDCELSDEADAAEKSETAYEPTRLPLEDPLLEVAADLGVVGKRIFAAVIASSVLYVFMYIFAWNSPWTSWLGAGINILWGIFLVLVGNLIWWRAFAPRSESKAIYLRSFHKDEESWPVRVAIQNALGEENRLSGIRDPRRRDMKLHDGFAPWLRAMRYCTPKFMDLEAGDDWKERLWNSLFRSELVFIDVSTLTIFVREEIRIASESIGLDRIGFITYAPQTPEHVHAILRQQGFEEDQIERAHILVWAPQSTGGSGIDGFRKSVAALLRHAISLPKSEPIPPPEWCYAKVSASSIPMSNRMMKWMILAQLGILLFQFLLIELVSLAISPSNLRTVLILLLMMPFFVFNAWIVLWNWYRYMVDIGSNAKRLRASLGLGLVMLAMLPVQLEIARSMPWRWSPPSALSAGQRDQDARLISKESSQ